MVNPFGNKYAKKLLTINKKELEQEIANLEKEIKLTND